VKLNWRDVAQAVIVASVLAVLAGAVDTYIQVRLLRHDLDRVEGIIDNLVGEVPPKH
jgi:hypothetical protein